ncbi:TPA: 16S rRNA (guanine(527)-N(7))-methyltransferase RsmG, partial [bacterium]|nr:16S rRNA (guanine(527)-N(7))-methyltransferase RsmG [bacterium]
MNKFDDNFKKRLEERKLFISDEKLNLFEIYATELKDWNSKINLTAIIDDLDIIDKHFIDSLLPLKYEAFNQGIKVADVGTGGGFPGIPLKICHPDINLTLIESIGKKVNFLNHIIDKLNLENVDIINNRAEIIGHNPKYRENYDFVVARCVARLPI